ncbi:MFS general substrate transporter [Clavulina sp. PMI_390]|nr:MFS general substrate transporter [Clavulina sp. PMI_390]
MASSSTPPPAHTTLPATVGTPAPATTAPPATIADPNIVTWDGPDDPANPKNWRFGEKWGTVTTVSLFTFMRISFIVASSMLAPALPQICRDLGIRSGSVLEDMVLSIFVLAYAVGPLFLGPLSEIVGRLPIIQLSNVWFLIFNFACSRATTKTQMLVFRFFAGLGGSAPLAIGGGIISDLFPPEQRGLATSLYTLAPLFGPTLGPIAGAWIAQKTIWQWIFYSTTIAGGLIQILGFILLQETYAPRLLAKKKAKLIKETGNTKLRTPFDHPDKTTSSIIINGLLRPLKLLATEPIVQVCAAYMAVLFGIMYLMLATFPVVWSVKYGESIGIGGLHYIALGIGFAFGTQLGARVLDYIYRRLKERNGGYATPEMRIPLMMVTSLFVPVSLLIYGWTVDKRVFWIVPDIGVVLYGFGTIGSFLCIQIYLIDNYQMFAASAVGAAASLRSLAGFGFPLFAQTMYSKLGLGWGNSVLALVALIFLPAPYLFYNYGHILREHSKFAKGNAAMGKAPPRP